MFQLELFQKKGLVMEGQIEKRIREAAEIRGAAERFGFEAEVVDFPRFFDVRRPEFLREDEVLAVAFGRFASFFPAGFAVFGQRARYKNEWCVFTLGIYDDSTLLGIFGETRLVRESENTRFGRCVPPFFIATINGSLTRERLGLFFKMLKHLQENGYVSSRVAAEILGDKDSCGDLLTRLTGRFY